MEVVSMEVSAEISIDNSTEASTRNFRGSFHGYGSAEVSMETSMLSRKFPSLPWKLPRCHESFHGFHGCFHRFRESFHLQRNSLPCAMEASMEAAESFHFLWVWKLPRLWNFSGSSQYHFRGSFQGAASTSTGFHVVPLTSTCVHFVP